MILGAVLPGRDGKSQDGEDKDKCQRRRHVGQDGEGGQGFCLDGDAEGDPDEQRYHHEGTNGADSIQ